MASTAALELDTTSSSITTTTSSSSNSASTAAAATSSFLGLHSAPLEELPWYERAYMNGPRPVPLPTLRSKGYKPPVPVEEMTPQQLRFLIGLEKFNRDVRNGWREKRGKRVRCPKPEKVRLIDWTQRDESLLAAAKSSILDDYARCPCIQCTILQRESQPVVDYRCSVIACSQLFTDFVELFEHQTRVHGKIYPTCRRVRVELFRQDRGTVPYPPVTVYAGQQLMRPGYRPIEWTLERVEQEKQTLRDELFGSKRYLGALHAWDSFIMAYHQIRQGGAEQLRAQYQTALEYYESSLVHPVATRSFQDGADFVGNGRNWFVSPELERAKYVTPFRFELEKKKNEQKENDSDEVVRFKKDLGAKRDAEDGREEKDRDDSDDGGDGNEGVSTLLEAGEPVVIDRRVVAAAAKKRQELLIERNRSIAELLVLDDKHRKKMLKCVVCGHEGHHRSHCKQFDPAIHDTRVFRCSHCGATGHNRVSCPNKRVKAGNLIRCRKCKLLGHTHRNCRQVGFEELDSKARKAPKVRESRSTK